MCTLQDKRPSSDRPARKSLRQPWPLEKKAADGKSADRHIFKQGEVCVKCTVLTLQNSYSLVKWICMFVCRDMTTWMKSAGVCPAARNFPTSDGFLLKSAAPLS